MILMGEEFFRLKKKIVAALKLPVECVKLTVRGTCQVIPPIRSTECSNSNDRRRIKTLNPKALNLNPKP